MKSNIKDFILNCQVCQKAKYSAAKKGGFIQPIPTPTEIWLKISRDFIIQLPNSKGYNNILVVVDLLVGFCINMVILPTSRQNHLL